MPGIEQSLTNIHWTRECFPRKRQLWYSTEFRTLIASYSHNFCCLCTIFFFLKWHTFILEKKHFKIKLYVLLWLEEYGSKDKRPGLGSLLSHSLALDSKARTSLSLGFFIGRTGTTLAFTGLWWKLNEMLISALCKWESSHQVRDWEAQPSLFPRPVVFTMDQ